MAERHLAGSTRGGQAMLAITSVATLLVLIDFATVVPTIQDTAATFGASVGWRTWALSAMSLGLAASLLTAGAMADQIGRRRTLRAGMAALAVSTVASAAAPDIAVFVAARVAQGVAGAAVLAAALAAVGHAFPAGPARIRATGIWAGALGGGIAAGPLLSSLLARHGDWRAAYWLEAALMSATVAWAGRLTESAAPRRRRSDVAGAVTLVGGMTALTAALITGRQSWSAAPTLLLLSAAVACVASFAVVEARHSEPMLDLRLLRHPAFLTSLTGALVVGLTTIALMSYAPSFLERALGWSALASSALLATWSTTSAVVAWQAHRMPSRVITRHRLALGLAICLLGLLWLGQLPPAGSWSGLMPGMLVTGVGTGLANAALGQLAVSSAPPGQPGLGSGANNTARYLGGAAGVAIVVALAVPTSARPSAGQFVSGWDAAATVCAVLCALGIAAALLLREPAPADSRTAPAAPAARSGAVGSHPSCHAAPR